VTYDMQLEILICDRACWMAQGQKVLAAILDYRSVTDAGDAEDSEWRRISAELACSPDLSKARVLLGMKVGGLSPLGCPGAAAG
jgi:hypothetical protein